MGVREGGARKEEGEKRRVVLTRGAHLEWYRTSPRLRLTTPDDDDEDADG